MVRIGVLLTHPKQELKKGELFHFNEEWAKKVPKKFVFKQDEGKHKRSGKFGTPTDVLTGTYIQHALQEKDVSVDLIAPEEVSKERLRSNDLNFLMVYDDLEAFHTDRVQGKPHFKKFKKCLEGADNVYPPRKYQEFVYSKINYYSYLQKKRVSVLPTFTMTSEEYEKFGHSVAVDKVLDFHRREGLHNVIAKPVLGQEGKDIEWFNGPGDRANLSYYIQKNMKKYPGLVFQKMVEGFGNSRTSPELRMYFMGNDYKYSVCAGAYASVADKVTRFYTPESEGGTLKAPMTKLKMATKKILKTLPPMVMPNGARLPRLITRLDMGYLQDGKYKPFVNEVEFVPSLYAECKPARKYVEDYIAHCAKQMVRITRQYVKSRSRRTATAKASRSASKATTSRHVLKSQFQKRKQRSA